jgi:hypothetical protein
MGSKRAEYAAFNELVHKLLHAAEDTPGMRRRLQSMWRALRLAKQGKNGLRGKAVLVHGDVYDDLQWCAESLEAAEAPSMPLASRQTFVGHWWPHVLVHYGDASLKREAQAETSGFGAWCVRGASILVIYGEWERWELEYFNINEFELHTMNMATRTFSEYVRGQETTEITHVVEFTDNEAAEAAGRSGVSSAPVFDAMLDVRDAYLRQHRLFCETERITSKANVWADDLSRGRVRLTLEAMAAERFEVKVLSVGGEARSMMALRVR